MWTIESGELLAVEPTAEELAAGATELASFYNESRELMANEGEMTAAEVVEWYGDLREDGGRAFFLFAGGRFVGDADLRDVGGDAAEFAIVLGGPAMGRGLGTRFAAMVHALAFRELGVGKLYVSIVPANRASIRLFEKLGYTRDASESARALIDDESDVTMSVDRAGFDAAVGPLDVELWEHA